jgi:hypothetical protein
VGTQTWATHLYLWEPAPPAINLPKRTFRGPFLPHSWPNLCTIISSLMHRIRVSSFAKKVCLKGYTLRTDRSLDCLTAQSLYFVCLTEWRLPIPFPIIYSLKETSVDREVHTTAGLEASATVSFPAGRQRQWGTKMSLPL